jgi:hypothetical protein
MLRRREYPSRLRFGFAVGLLVFGLLWALTMDFADWREWVVLAAYLLVMLAVDQRWLRGPSGTEQAHNGNVRAYFALDPVRGVPVVVGVLCGGAGSLACYFVGASSSVAQIVGAMVALAAYVGALRWLRGRGRGR